MTYPVLSKEVDVMAILLGRGTEVATAKLKLMVSTLCSQLPVV